MAPLRHFRLMLPARRRLFSLVMINDRRSCAATRMEGLKMYAGGEQRQQQQQLRRLLSMYVRRNEEGEEGMQLLYSAVSCSPLGRHTHLRKDIGCRRRVQTDRRLSCSLDAAVLSFSAMPGRLGPSLSSPLGSAQGKERRNKKKRMRHLQCNGQTNFPGPTASGKTGNQFPPPLLSFDEGQV